MDVFSISRRREIMSKIKSKNTRPEKVVRSVFHSMGYRFRLHDSTLPGTPDLVLKKHRTVVFVNGCYWHVHKNCKMATQPKSNTEYWNGKLKRNVERDLANQKILEEQGWRVFTIWECQILKGKDNVRELICEFFS